MIVFGDRGCTRGVHGYMAGRSIGTSDMLKWWLFGVGAHTHTCTFRPTVGHVLQSISCGSPRRPPCDGLTTAERLEGRRWKKLLKIWDDHTHLASFAIWWSMSSRDLPTFGHWQVLSKVQNTSMLSSALWRCLCYGNEAYAQPSGNSSPPSMCMQPLDLCTARKLLA